MNELGQVFTPEKIACVMVQLLLKNARKNVTFDVLDPCIGNNVFFSQLNKTNYSFNYQGVEIDKKIINKSANFFNSGPNRTLYVGNFFDYSKGRKAEFDFVITNPPYVRHEMLVSINNKKQIRDLFLHKNYNIPSQSNLYVYFLLRSIDLLKDGGKLVAIVYDSWLYSAYGESFKKILLRLGNIDSVIHFQNEVFENVDVGATIIEFTKGIQQKDKIKYASFKNSQGINNIDNIQWFDRQIDRLTNDIDNSLSTNNLIELGSVAEINRGTSALSNKLFVFKEKKFKDVIPFLKSIKNIDTMSVLNDKYLLFFNDNFSKESLSYLQEIKSLIVTNEHKYKNLAKKINNGNNWYLHTLAKPGDLIFNYYLRDSFDFILNVNKLQSSDNFYNLRFKSDLLFYFSILNSTKVKNSILSHSRLQGRGLRKIQLYKFRKILIPDKSAFNDESVVQLQNLGKLLSDQKRNSAAKEEIISKIDEIIETALNNYA